MSKVALITGITGQDGVGRHCSKLKHSSVYDSKMKLGHQQQAAQQVSRIMRSLALGTTGVTALHKGRHFRYVKYKGCYPTILGVKQYKTLVKKLELTTEF